MTAPTDAAFDLLRFALLCELAVDLDDPVLARRAARHATNSARLLSCLDWQPTGPVEEDDDSLPEVDDLLERLPSRREVEGEDPEAQLAKVTRTRPLAVSLPAGGDPSRGRFQRHQLEISPERRHRTPLGWTRERRLTGGSSAAPSSARGPLPPTEVPR